MAMLDRGISTRRGIMNIHLEKAYTEAEQHRVVGSLARSELAQTTTIILPLYAQMTEAEVDRVVDALAEVLRLAQPVSAVAV